jgi:hypothetical protein
MINRKILTPYQKVNLTVFRRENLFDVFEYNDVFQESATSSKWKTMHWREEDHTHFDGLRFDTAEDAMKHLDSTLIEEGYILIDNWDDVKKYRCLI